MSLAPLFELSTQFQAKNGRNNTAGFLRVFLAGTDDPAVTYSDYNGTLNTRDIYLDDDGRAVVICDNTKAYRLEVYDANGMLMWTEEPVWCTGSGGGSGSVTDIVSQDGSIVVSETTVGQVTTFDLSIAPDSSEMLEWVETENTGVGDGTVIPGFVDGTMEVIAGSGLFLQANEMYHVTNSFTVTPVGNGINYDTLNVKLMLDSTELCSRSYDIDNSLNDTVECEFSYDVSTTADGYLYWVISGASAFSNVDAKMQLHRVYSGIAAVPSTYATKTYVDSGLSSRIAYSALEFNTGSQITGISGSAIGAAGVDPNEFVPWSASGVFQPSGDYVSATDFSACCSSMSAAVSSVSSDLSSLSGVVSGLTGTYLEQSAFSAYTSTALTGLQQDTADISAAVSAITGQTGNYIDWSASGTFQPSGNYASASDLANYLPNSAIEGAGGKVTGISGSAIKGHEYTGVFPVSVDNTSDTISVANKTLAVDDTMTGYESAGSAIIGVNTATVLSGLTAYQPSGDYAYNSALSSKMDASASSDFYPFSGNPSGFLTAHQSLAGYATEGYVDSSVSGKLDATASAQFITSLPPDLAYTSDVASAVSGKLDASASSDFYPMSGNPSGFLTAHQSLAGYATEQYVDSAVSGKLDSSAYNSGDFYSTSNPSGFITGVDLTDYATTAYVDSSVSGKLDASASASFQPSGNYQPSGDYAFNSALTAYQPVSGMTAYAPSGDYAENSALDLKQDASAMTAYQLSGDYYSASNPSGFITGVDLSDYATTGYVDSSVSGKLDASASSDFYSTSNPSGFITGVDLSDYQTVSGMTAYQLSGDYYSATNPSGFITGVDLTDYATTAFVDSSVSGKMDTSAMTAYQLSGDYAYNSSLSAYQPSGDYIYASALGTGVI